MHQAISGVGHQSRANIAARYPLLTKAGLISAWTVGLLAAFRGIQLGITDDNLGSDAHAYWLTGQGESLTYDLAPGQPDAFLYSPAFADAVWPLAQLPWPLFLSAWIALEQAVLVWLVKPLTLRWAVPLGLLCVPELVNGNVYLLLAGVAVAGLRHPALWALPALTKVLPGVGLVWFGIRGEWSRLLLGAVVTLGMVAASYAAHPAPWHDWVEFLFTRAGTREPAWVFFARQSAAVALLVWGARTGRPWVLAVVMMLASPALAPTTAVLLIALPRLLDVPVDRQAAAKWAEMRADDSAPL